MRLLIDATTACTRPSNCASARRSSLLPTRCQADSVRPSVKTPTAAMPGRLSRVDSRPCERADTRVWRPGTLRAHIFVLFYARAGRDILRRRLTGGSVRPERGDLDCASRPLRAAVG